MLCHYYNATSHLHIKGPQLKIRQWFHNHMFHLYTSVYSLHKTQNICDTVWQVLVCIPLVLRFQKHKTKPQLCNICQETYHTHMGPYVLWIPFIFANSNCHISYDTCVYLYDALYFHGYKIYTWTTHVLFIDILQGCFSSTGTIIRLPRWLIQYKDTILPV